MQRPHRFRLLVLLFVAFGLLATTSVWAQDDDPTRPIYLPIITDGEADEGTLPGEPDATATTAATDPPTATLMPGETPAPTAAPSATPMATATLLPGETPPATAMPSSTPAGSTPTATFTPPPTQPAAWPTIGLSEIATDFDDPVYVTHAGEAEVLYIVEQPGVVQRYEVETAARSVFLDIQDITELGRESGLLSLAFPGDFGEEGDDGVFYLNHTVRIGGQLKTHVRRAVSPDGGLTASLLGDDPLLAIDQPYANHNGGQLQFGPDGYLYIGMGDGGDGGDPQNRAQDGNTLLGKMLRLDVESVETGYAIPDDNPFVDDSDFADEIWSYGLRNPWRFSFDRETGDLYTADVGQVKWEEVNFQPAASDGGENYGWRITEGAHCFNPADCSFEGLTLPVAEYSHDEGFSITGGYVYRGETHPALQGIYFYADFVNGKLWGLRRHPAADAASSSGWETELLLDSGFQLSSFGEDVDGNLYVLDYEGVLYEVVDAE